MDDDKGPKLGEMCWLEIPVHDVSRAQALYADVFGWVFQPEGVPHGRHGIEAMHFFTKGAVRGALLRLMDGYQATKYGRLDREVLPPLPTFCVEDCADALDKVAARGGQEQ